MAVQPLSQEHDARQVAIPPLVRRNTWLMAITQAIAGAGTQLIPALGAIQVLALLGNATFSGITSSLMSLARMLSAYPVGRLTDRRGRKIGFYIGLWLCLVGSLTVGLATLSGSFFWFSVGILIFGGGIGSLQQMRVAAADMYPPSRRSEGISLILMGSLFGAGISPLVVWLGARIGAQLKLSEMALAWLLVPLLILPCFVLILNIKPDPQQIAQRLSSYYPDWALAKGARSIASGGSSPVYLAAILSAVTVQGQMVMLMAMTSLALKMQDSTLPQISLSVSIHVMGMFAFSWFIGRFADRFGRKPAVLIGLLLSGLGSLLVGLGSSYLIITTGTFLVGLGWSAAFLASNTILTDITPPARRGQAIGILESWSSLAGMILPLLGGVVVEYLSLNVLGFLGVLLVVVPLVLMGRVREGTPGNYS